MANLSGVIRKSFEGYDVEIINVADDSKTTPETAIAKSLSKWTGSQER